MITSGAIQRQKGDLRAGSTIGRYRVEDPVGRGGMGTVYSAYDERTNRTVALKLLAEGIPATLRSRFLAECEAEANIRHEHVMPVYDRGWLTEERPYFVMELLYEPITLTELIEEISRGMLGSKHPRLRQWNDLRRLIGDVVVPICEGVHVANEEYGVQHRDLKPDNVLIDIRTRRAYLIDFGICREMDDDDDVGKIVGTPRFLSPEQADGGTDRRTDVWGLGALLRYVVTGEPPIAGTSPFTRADVNKRIEALKKAEEQALDQGENAKARGYAGRRTQLEDPTLRVQEDLMRDASDGVYVALPEGTSKGLVAIITKAMSKGGDQRYATAGELAADLKQWLKGGGVAALQEATTRGAAVDWVRRLFNRNVVRGGGAVVAILLGFLVGTGVFAKTPPQPDHRLEDASEDIDRVEEDWKTTLDMQRVDAPLGPVGRIAFEYRFLTRMAALKSRVKSLPAGEEQRTLMKDAAALESRASRGRLRLVGWSPSSWNPPQQLLAPSARYFETNDRQVTLDPGAYSLRSAPDPGFSLSLVVPSVPGHGFARAGDGVLERVVELRQSGLRVPDGMTWIPAGPARPGAERDMRAFLAGRRLVTNEMYSEWLDDLPVQERQDRVPPTGFRRDGRDQMRWLAVQDTAGQAVRGVRPKDADAYCRWRADVLQIKLSLPTESEWQRMTAIERMRDPGARLVFPYRHGGTAISRVDASPFGVKNLFAGPGEIVAKDDGSGFVLKAKGGMLPMPTAATRSYAVKSDATGHQYGFRLVYAP